MRNFYFSAIKLSKLISFSLCIYEILRFAFFIGGYISLAPQGGNPFPWLAAIAPCALFILMAIFWHLDLSRYRLFAPLFLAGKGFSLVALFLWIFTLDNSLVVNLAQLRFTIFASFFFVLGDFLSILIAVNILNKEEE